MQLLPGAWELIFDVGEVKIPVRLNISLTGKWSIINSSEVISIDSVNWENDNFHVKLPLFNSVFDGKKINERQISGTWTDNSRDSLYQISFEAKFKEEAPSTKAFDMSKLTTYDAVFSPDNEKDKTNAIGLLNFDKNKVEGTFMTESGDFRFLEGESTGNNFYLSCFDGTHLFYFTATRSDDSLISGTFYSGKHWKEPWRAHSDSEATLRNPDSLTTTQNTSGKLRFVAKSTSGENITFDSTTFKGKVSIVQVFGSWCPNCTDESLFLKSLYSKYKTRGLQIIPVAFERMADFDKNKKIVSNQFAQLGLPYNWYFGGIKSEASGVFADLSKITSFPTAIFIDKAGKIRKIHTGFYGPGTGKYFTYHTEILDMFVQQLLDE